MSKTSHPNSSTSLTLSQKETMWNYWIDCPNEHLANLFYYDVGSGPSRALKFSVDKATLSNLLSYVGNSDYELTFYMTANPNIPYGIVGNQPSFNLIVQAMTTDSPPSSINENSYIANWEPVHPVYIDIPISEGLAFKIINSWEGYLKQNIPHIVNTFISGETTRILSTTFSKSDSGEIRNIFQDNEDKDVILNLYLGHVMPVSIEEPFGLRVVVEIEVSGELDGDASTRAFFEFSNPCPPLCKLEAPPKGGN